MRGQKLYIRPIEPPDRDEVAAFLRAQGRPADTPPTGLLGKLVGELVAVVVWEIAGDETRIADVVVAAELRRKRIGRLMIDEAARIAVKMDSRQLVAEPPPESRGFFERIGFRVERGRLVRALAMLLFAVTLGCSRPTPAPPPVVAAPEVEQLPATIDEARALHASGNLTAYEEALRSLAASQDEVTSRRARALLALFFFDQKRWDEAIPALQAAAAADRRVAPSLRLRIAEAESERGRFAEAASAATAVIAEARESGAATVARLRLPAIHARLGDAAATGAAFELAMAIAIDESTEADFVALAEALDAAARSDLAARLRLRLLTGYAQGRYTEKTYSALASRQTAALESLPLADLVSLASKLAGANRYDQSLDLLERIARLHPGSSQEAMVRSVRMRAQFNSRNYGRLLEETAGVKLGEPALMLMRARAAWRAGRPAEFLEGLLALEREFPASREALEGRVLRARYYMSDEPRYDLAAYNLMSAIEGGLPGNDGENLWTLGWVFVLSGRDDAALETFSRYLGQYPDADYTSNSLFWTGKVHERNGRIAERDAAFRELIAKYPHGYFSYRARVIMGSADSAHGPSPRSAPDGAAPAQDDMFSLAGIDTGTVDELLAIGLDRDAVREMKLLAAQHPDNAGVAFKLADVYARGGEPFRANTILQRRFRQIIRHGGENIPRRFWEILYPLRHWETLRREAEKRGLDPYLLASIIRQESGFEPTVVSNAGAVGLMQIMPREAPGIAARAGIGEITRDDLFDPETNIAVGAAELQLKLQLMNGNPIYAIAAYNAGQEAVGRWIAQSPVDDVDLFVESIPYAETRLYVKSVTRNRFEYRRIYESSTLSPDLQAATP